MFSFLIIVIRLRSGFAYLLIVNTSKQLVTALPMAPLRNDASMFALNSIFYAKSSCEYFILYNFIMYSYMVN
jgi:hypothetical protein